MCETFFFSPLTFQMTSIEMLVTSLKFALMDCYGHGILVKMCYAMVRKCIFGMKLTEFLRYIKEECVYERTFDKWWLP